ncbi:hypothetical protein N7U49_48055 (plasmid) [Streptomyces sp. AD2-2]|nr:hypothetical protein N7U49_48055 [Streptomyces sp. AD2-2]
MHRTEPLTHVTNADLAFNHTCWKYIGTGADGCTWPPHVESDDDSGPPEYVDFLPQDVNLGSWAVSGHRSPDGSPVGAATCLRPQLTAAPMS